MRRSFHQIFRGGVLAGVLCLMVLLTTAGCATQRVIKEDKPLSETRLFVTRSGENVTLSWESRPDWSYTILYNESMSARAAWNVLPGHDFIRGTGRMLVYKDRVPLGENRAYRLQIDSAVSLSP